MEEGQNLELTYNELLVLSDALSMFTRGMEKLSPTELLLKLGGALLETGPDKPPVKVTLTAEELWVVREVAKSPITVGTEKVGLNLLRKAYSALRADQVANLEGSGSEDLPRKEEVKHTLEGWNQEKGG